MSFSSLISWLRSVYSEPDGGGSSTRVHVGPLIVFVVGVGVRFAHLVASKAITPEQFNSFLGAAGGFLGMACGVLYGSNKVADVLKSNKSGGQ